MKKYIKHEMEITEYDIEDVITTSPEADPNNGEGQGAYEEEE